ARNAARDPWKHAGLASKSLGAAPSSPSAASTSRNRLPQPSASGYRSPRTRMGRVHLGNVRSNGRQGNRFGAGTAWWLGGRCGRLTDDTKESTVPDLAHVSALDLADAIRRRQVSSREALEYFLARIAALDKTINSVVTIDAERARAEADEADRLLARGETGGSLHGEPMTV